MKDEAKSVCVNDLTLSDCPNLSAYCYTSSPGEYDRPLPLQQLNRIKVPQNWGI
ncbi:MAG: hypothetical protein HC769_14155 [Cyanobacteria bacterium CRU_2_1]|nr:hypothetical protein [Cyanobacteria bacterium RU_5_0]NJR59873.1 hypothetical protein [Cyanobacteria bacterium CRU_2_1]